jgi:hypothetical protein
MVFILFWVSGWVLLLILIWHLKDVGGRSGCPSLCGGPLLGESREEPGPKTSPGIRGGE